MKTVDESEIPALLAQKIPPLIIRDTPGWNQFLNDFAPLGVEVERRKAAAKATQGA